MVVPGSVNSLNVFSAIAVGMPVTWYPVIGEGALPHRSRPWSCPRRGLVPTLVPLLIPRLPRGHHPQASSLALDDEVGRLSVLLADMREVQNVEGLRPAFSPRFPVGDAMWSTCDQERVVSLGFQTERLETRLQVH